ncbi:MAG: sulfotransferase [Fidelibacterota bacterium]
MDPKLKKILLPVYHTLLSGYTTLRALGKRKIFCIGMNKTGTTSLKEEMLLQGYPVGNQRRAERLIDDWAKRDFRRIIRHCRTAQFFQDVPFSYPYTFIVMDHAFPGSKFILTVRDSAEAWYDSVIRFHGKKWGRGNVPPTAEDLKHATYLYKGRPYHTRKLVYDVSDDDIYNKAVMLDHYRTHIRNVKDYFRHRPGDLLVINLKDRDSYPRFCEFLGIRQERDAFPWVNKT